MVPAILTIGGCIFLFVATMNAAGWPGPRRKGAAQGRVSALIPARNEEANIAACIESILAQGPIVSEVIVYDDHSTDRTAAVVADCGATDPRVRLAETSHLPEGWCGKNFACDRLAAASSGDWLLFVDADTRLMPGAAESLVREMTARRLGMLSLWPGLEMASFWEKTLMPLLNFTVFSIFPAPFSLLFYWPSLAIAHGACIMFSAGSYRRIGGHDAVRDQIFEDVRLAQLWRAKGARGLCLDGQLDARVRMYSSFGEIWRGFQKNFFPAFRNEISFWAFMAFHIFFFLSPFLMATARPSKQALAACATVLLTRIVLALKFRHPLWSILLHPLAEAVLIAIGLSSWWRCKSGQGVSWKGREYHKTA